MKVTGGYHGTMRHRTHAEGFHALSTAHISTSAPHTQDPPFKTQHRGKHPSHPPPRPSLTQTHRSSLLTSSQATSPKTTTEQNIPTTKPETRRVFADEQPMNHYTVLSVTIPNIKLSSNVAACYGVKKLTF